MPGGKVGIGFACLAGAIIVLLMVVPFSPAALTPVEWGIVLLWLIIGLILSAITQNSKKKAM